MTNISVPKSKPKGKGRMKVAYIAGPFRSDQGNYGIHCNVEHAATVALRYWMKGYAVICPHKNSEHFDGAMPDPAFLEGGLSMIRRLRPDLGDIVVMIKGWRESKGSKAERRLAINLGITVVEDTMP